MMVKEKKSPTETSVMGMLNKNIQLYLKMDPPQITIKKNKRDLLKDKFDNKNESCKVFVVQSLFNNDFN